MILLACYTVYVNALVFFPFDHTSDFVAYIMTAGGAKLNSKSDLLLCGIARGDKNGGPTELARILHESLSSCRRLDADDLSRRYLEWWKTDAFDTGPTFALVFERVADGMALTDAVKEADSLLNGLTAGCGPAQRIAPLAACPTIPTPQLAAAAREEARITHLHPHAGDAAVVVALLCRHLLEGKPWALAKDLVAEHEQDAWAAIHAAPISNGGYALDVVRTALYFLESKDPLARAVMFAGPQNYCPVIVGALEAARGVS
jgi:ADP-ribosyl-[dinitrogen reductase] hydrolase